MAMVTTQVTTAPVKFERSSSRFTQAGSTIFVVDTGRLLWCVFLGCVIVEVSMVYLDLAVNWLRWSESGPIRRMFNITREDGLASWFAVTQTVFVALTSWFILALTSAQNGSRGRRTGWLVIALFFTYMAVDDGAVVHERVGSAFKAGTNIGYFPSYTWQILFVPFFAAMGLFVLVFTWRELSRSLDRWLVVVAIGCFSMAVAMDFVEGLEDGYLVLVDRLRWEEQTVRHFSKSIEEFIEMLGMSVLLVTYLGHVARKSSAQIILRFTRENEARPTE